MTDRKDDPKEKSWRDVVRDSPPTTRRENPFRDPSPERLGPPEPWPEPDRKDQEKDE